MPRKQRFRVAGIPQLVHQRGHNGGHICEDQSDLRTLYGCIAEAAAEYECEVHAYAMLKREFYLLVTPTEEGGVSRAMQAVGRQYVPWYNAAYRRSGALWEGRYRACIVEPGLRVLDCYRFIEQQDDERGNAGTVGRNRWSSGGAHVRGARDSLIADHDVFRDLGTEPRLRSRSYAGLCQLQLASESCAAIDYALLHCLAYASESYKDWLEDELAHSVRLGQPGRPRRPKLVTSLSA